MAPHLNTPEEIDRIERRHAATGGRALPGAAELLARAHAVVTSCSPDAGRRALRGRRPAGARRADHLRPARERGKPHPDPYLAAAAALGADPADCVVIEDAPAGIAAARAAGMTVWAVATTHRPDELAGADRVVADLDEVRQRLSSSTAP